MNHAPVVAATDLSAGGDEATRQAAELSSLLGCPLVVVHAVSDLIGGRLDEAEAKRALGERVAGLTENLPSDPEVVVVRGSAPGAILELADRADAALVVLGAGETHVPFVGGTAEQVVRHAPCSVLVARPSPAQGAVVAATDFSQYAEPAVAAAVTVAGLRRSELVLAHSIHVPVSPLSVFGPLVIDAPSPVAREEQKQVARQMLDTSFASFGLSGRALVLEGVPARAIARAAEETGAGLVVVGTHGRTGFERIALGSEAERILRTAPCSVLVVRRRSGEPGLGVLGDRAREVAPRIPPSG